MLEDLQGKYDITYQSTPPQPDWYEPGYGQAEINGNKLIGFDALGVRWDATLELRQDGILNFQAVLDPRTSGDENVVLLDNSGNMTREPQHYTGEIKVTKFGGETMLRTVVIQGPITINVQFRKKT